MSPVNASRRAARVRRAGPPDPGDPVAGPGGPGIASGPVSEAVQRVRDALRALGAEGEVRTFTEAVPTAAAAAERLGCPVGAIANSLVFAVAGEPILVLTSGAHRVDTARVATHLGVGRNKVKRAGPDLVLAATGQPVGGVAPVGHPRPVPTVVDSALAAFDTVWAGAGDKHSMFPTSHDELVRITGGSVLDVGQPAPTAPG
jgi:prolyl-tRNA editing enzyme YbaK/EbsC (Cys-tRNA(Pro) deacylase)